MPPFLFFFNGTKMIQIDVSDVPAEIRDGPEFIREYEAHFEKFNSSRFDKKERAIICLHEATHVVYCRELGFEPKFYGPAIWYDEILVKFRRVDACVEGLPYEIKMKAEPLLVAKQFMGPYYVEPKLIVSSRTENQIWHDAFGDLCNYCDWKARRRKLGEVKLSFDAIRDSVYRDLRSPRFRKKLWDTAKEFEAQVFGPEAMTQEKAA
jgi:hypothetical protein